MLYIWVEGEDDVRFFNRIIVPRLENKFECIQVTPYAKMEKKKLMSFIKNIKAMGADYLFTTDLNGCPCVSDKKTRVLNKYSKNIASERIVVVVREIESWYVAGLGDTGVKKHGLSGVVGVTDGIGKEEYSKLIPKAFESRIDFMVENLNEFDVEVGKQKNRSFRYFMEKHVC